jgi:MFS family permease
LSLSGYLLAGVGSLIIGIFYVFHLSIIIAYLGVSLLGFAVGAIETFEPTIISFTAGREKSAKSFGYLSSSRSIGLFTGNLLMGILYFFNPFYSYFYAFLVSVAAALIVYLFGRNLNLK